MKWTRLAGLVATLALTAIAFASRAQSRNESLLVVTELGPNGIEIHGVGANRPSYQASWNLYDRLLTCA